MNADNFDIDRATGAILEQRTRWVAQAAEARRKLLAAWPRLLSVLRLLPDPAMYMYADELRIEVRLGSFKMAEPMLASIQDVTGVEFSKTEDDARYGTRTYTLKDFPLSLVVNVSDNDDAAACRRVVVGEEVVPVFKLVCDDEAGDPA